MRPIERLLWWLVPLAGLAVVLLTGYQAVTTRRYDFENGIAGELVAGRSAGQTFVARYDNLSGVELHLGTYHESAAPARASLVFHLRDTPGPGPDLATARLPAGTDLAQNPWYLFSFPAISGSQDKTFYIEIESPDGAPGKALTAFWWQPGADGKGDPYASGTAYLDGKAQPGDLAFGLHYSASPLSVASQLARAISANIPPGVLSLLFVGVAAALGALYCLLYVLREPEQRRRWLKRWSLPLVLAVALLNGLLYVFLVPPWQGPDEHTHFTYAALLDRYGLDADSVQALYLQAQPPDEPLVRVVTDSMARHDFTRHVGGQPTPGSPPDARATIFYSVRQPPTYYWLGAIALRAARASGIAADPYVNPETSLVVLRCVSLLLGLVVVALAWLLARVISTTGGNWLLLLLPLTVALLPMHTFDAAIANNDVLAEVAVSALLVTLVALLRFPGGWRGLSLAALAVLISLGSLFTKSTGTAAAFPLLIGGLLVWLGVLVTRTLDRRAADRADARKQVIAVPGVILVLAALAVIGTLSLAYEPQNRAAGWVLSRTPLWRIPSVETGNAHDGRYVLELGARGQQAIMAFQVLLPPVYHPAFTMTVSGWVRAVPEAGPPLVQSPVAALKIEEGGFGMGRTDVFLDQAGVWQPISATAHLIEGTQQVVLRITASDQRAQFDDFAMQVANVSGPWSDPIFRPTLLNPSAEAGTVGLRPGLVDRLPIELVTVAEVMPNPQPFDVPALWLQYSNEQYRSFWGNFGWESLPLPDGLYALLGLIAVLALAGLALLATRRWGHWGIPEWLGTVSLIALVVTVLSAFAWQTMRLATQGIISGLYGRYLFVLIIPIVWLILAGLGALLSLFRRREIDSRESGLPWGTWLWTSGLVLFAAYCLFSLIIPFYYA